MPRPKSLLKNVSIDRAGKSHNCQHVRTHRILTGEKRLKLKVDRTYEHFCKQCALNMIDADITKLQLLKEKLLNEEE
jgi:glutaminase